MIKYAYKFNKSRQLDFKTHRNQLISKYLKN